MRPHGLAPVLLLALVSSACNDEKSAAGCDASAVSAGTASASLDGSDWSAPATWSLAGPSVQIVTEEGDGWRMTIVAQTTGDGSAVGDLVSAGTFPIEVDLVTGGFVTVYVSGESSSYTSKSGAGTLTLSGLADGVLSGCADFDAATTSGDSVSAEELLFQATTAG